MSTLFFFFFFFFLLPFSSCVDYTDLVYAGCSQSNSPYQFSLDSLLSSLANSPYANFTSPSPPLSALYQCRSDLPLPTCSACVRSALSHLSSLCPLATSAAVQLNACYIRYSNDSFIGKPDTTLIYHKCGAPAPASSVLGMRDAALAQLGSAQGGYRVGSAGLVQAIAQCVGDQSKEECGECMSAAVAQAKELCGLDVGGNVYLGKCYVMYWSNAGYYSGSSAMPRDPVQEAGRTVAIIIGLLIAIALLIVALSFIRRKAGKGGK